MNIAIVGAGWAGLAAAVQAAHAGHAVTVLESARTLGGRARGLPGRLPDGSAVTLDNGQHILIGAYTETLRLMHLVGVDAAAALRRLPLVLRFPDGRGLKLPQLPAPLDALAGILTARGWHWRDKLALLRTAAGWQRGRFECAPAQTVAGLCAGLTPRVMAELIEPLCVSALNLPAADASGQVFLRVLRDALFGISGGSHLLLPSADLGALFPEAAARWLAQRGGRVVPGHRVQHLQADGPHWQVDGARYDRVILACPPTEAARLAEDSGAPAADWSRQARALDFTAITTVYAASAARLAQPMVTLRCGPGAPAQFAFDRGQLGGPAGLLAFVASASQGERGALEQQVLAQARQQLGLSGLHLVQTVVEKRATFACTPGLRRPGLHIAAGLLACGDYVDGPYPATLEGATRSGTAAALSL
ncbi:hydroxysqualene dehydroxylase HpnE [Variovorax terrae]|uniref:Hydroxysqualene dehydroxylase HpnE n=1 Tax=Variovorax terrae TaxID=2923278 RepID=A0A9X1VVM8_9BURK|nr:hydroxysqualene dehydroxylase HpnE [Variovorax terrae]MCJ0762854.1 hydroxysqualene dehydroxylase HpnE [Variovorax terrae]